MNQLNQERAHDESDTIDEVCWCGPVLWYETENNYRLWVHRTAEGELPDEFWLANVLAAMCFEDEEDMD